MEANNIREPIILVSCFLVILICAVVGIYLSSRKPSKEWQEKVKKKYDEEMEEASRKLKERDVMACEILRVRHEACKIKPECRSNTVLPGWVACVLFSMGLCSLINLLQKNEVIHWSKHLFELILLIPVGCFEIIDRILSINPVVLLLSAIAVLLYLILKKIGKK